MVAVASSWAAVYVFCIRSILCQGFGGKNELENCRYSGLRRCFIFADKVHIHNTSHCQPDVVCTLSAVLQGPPALDDVRLVCHSCFQVLTSLMLIYVKSKSPQDGFTGLINTDCLAQILGM